MKMLCIHNGKIIDGISESYYKGDVLIDKGKIIEISCSALSHKADKVIDAEGLWVMPGFIDVHCHLREPGLEYKEDIASGTRSAAAGGFTSIACMPNTEPAIDNAAVVNYIRTKAALEGKVKVYPIGAITKGRKGKELTEMKELLDAGVIALSDDGDPVSDSRIMRLALEYAGQWGLPIISHCEDKSLAGDGVMNEGVTSTILGLKGITPAAEEVMVARDVILAKITGAPLHIAHVSTKGSVEIIRLAKAMGISVTCETAPHYFSANEKWVEGYDTNTKVNPPLRTEEDMDAIKIGLLDGTIDIIATDHAPHHRDDKEIEYPLAASGISGFETAFALGYTNLVEQNILSMADLVNKMSTIPAKIFKINGGTLEVGKAADITIASDKEEYEIDVQKFYSKGKNSPFHGKKVKGKIMYTIVDGKVVYDNGKIV